MKTWLSEKLPQALQHIKERYEAEAQPYIQYCLDVFDDANGQNINNITLSDGQFESFYFKIKQRVGERTQDSHASPVEVFDYLTSLKEAYQRLCQQKSFLEKQFIPRLNRLATAQPVPEDIHLFQRAAEDEYIISQLKFYKDLPPEMRAGTEADNTYRQFLRAMQNLLPHHVKRQGYNIMHPGRRMPTSSSHPFGIN